MRIWLIVFLISILTASCRASGIALSPPLAVEQGALPSRLTIVSWNVHKQSGARLQGDLTALFRQQRPALVFLQEATAELHSTQRTGLFAPSWQYPLLERSATGVLTVSEVAPRRSEVMQTRWRELFLATPKVALATEYLLPDGRHLLAINVHCLNFERWGTLKFRAQLTALQELMAKHTGPILLAGDFNTWNQRRLRLMTTLARDLQLSEVEGFAGPLKTGDQQSAVLNWLLGIDHTLPLDRVYYRGLVPLSAGVLPFTSSDHRALQVTFAVEEGNTTISGSHSPLKHWTQVD